MNDEQWEQHVEQARQQNEDLKQVEEKQTDIRANVCFALLSPMCLFLSFLLPANSGAYLLFPVWCIGGLGSLAVLATYAFTNRVSYKAKDGALCFLLGNILVFFVFLLKPT